MNNLFEFKTTENTCYNPKSDLTENSLNNILSTDFEKKTYITSSNNNDLFYDCKQEALENNRDYFLISDFSNTSTNNYSYKCYIPNASLNCEISSNFDYLFEPLNSVINSLFGEVNNRTNDICDNILDNLRHFSNFKNETSCINYNVDNKSLILPTKNKFVLYKTELVDNNIIDNLSINEISHYINKNDDNPGVLDTNILEENFVVKINDLSQAMVEDICEYDNTGNTRDFKKIGDALNDLDEFYKYIFNNLFDLSRDISNISLLTKHDTLYLKSLEEKLDEERKKLKNLFGVDGANNGKLFDVKYMKNLKLNEIIIISLLLIFLIFIYSKKK